MTTKTNKRTRKEAKKLMWEYYRDNKAALPEWIGEYREEIILKISEGVHPGTAMNEVSAGDSHPT